MPTRSVGLFTWVFLGDESLLRALQERVLPDIEGVVEEHRANLALALDEYRLLLQRHPTVTHARATWRDTEAQLVERIARARMLDGDQLRDLVRDIVDHEQGRQVAEPEAYHRYKILLVVWASLFEAERHGQPDRSDERFRLHAR